MNVRDHVPPPLTSLRNMLLDDVRLRLLTWNLHARPWPFANPESRLERVAHEVVRLAPDVAVFQEVWTNSGGNTLDAVLRQAGYSAVTAAGRSVGRSSGGLIAFCRNPWSLIEPAIFHEYRAHASSWRFWEGDGAANKGVLGMRLQHVSGTPAVVLNTHLQSQYGLDVETPGVVSAARSHKQARSAQVAELNGVVGRFDPNLPVLIAGDFNTFPPEWQQLRPPAWRELTSQLRERCWPCGTYLERNGRNTVEKGWLDYVFVRESKLFTVKTDGETRIIENTAVDVPYSDHHGILLDIAIVGSPVTFFVARLTSASSRRAWMMELVQFFMGRSE